MKKNIIIIISITTLVFVIYHFRIYDEKPEISLSGNKLTDYIYAYNLNLKDIEVNDIFINKTDVYYLVSNINQYFLYKSNIYKKDLFKVSEKNKGEICELKLNFIECRNEKEIITYDLTFNKINSFPIDYKIPYKNTYLNYKNNNLYIYENGTIFRELAKDLNLKTYFYTKENTIILFNDTENKTYYLYDIENKLLDEIDATNYDIYQNGFYFTNNNTIINKDYINNETINYPNSFNIKLDYVTTLNENILYEIDNEKKEINIYDLETNTKSYLNIDKIDEVIIDLRIYDNFLYLFTSNNEISLYIIDLEKISKNFISSSDTNIDELVTKANEINNTYNINLKIKDDAIIKFPDFTAKPMYDESIIESGLNKINTTILNFNKEFFNNFYLNDMKGLNIYLTSNLTPSDYETQIANPAAYSLINNNEYTIVIDINEPNIEELFCHELMHNIEFNLENKNIKAFYNWENLNPENFYYLNSYTSPSKFNYTLTEESKDLVYFIRT